MRFLCFQTIAMYAVFIFPGKDSRTIHLNATIVFFLTMLIYFIHLLVCCQRQWQRLSTFLLLFTVLVDSPVKITHEITKTFT